MLSKLQQRLNDPEYKNWMKSGQALNILNESLQPISEQKMTTFHERLKKKNVFLNKCSTCKPRMEPAKTCKTCNTWKNDIFKEHSNWKMNNWTNVDSRRWPEDKWEVAKTYMPRGQKPGSYEPDICSVLNLMYTCKIFQPDIEKRKIEKVLQVRNDVMHSKNMKVSDGELKEHLNAILKMFDNLVKLKLPNVSQKNVKTNMQMVAGLEKHAFNVSSDQPESSVDGMSNSTFRLQNDVQQLETDLDSIEDQLSNQKRTRRSTHNQRKCFLSPAWCFLHCCRCTKCQNSVSPEQTDDDDDEHGNLVWGGTYETSSPLLK